VGAIHTSVLKHSTGVRDGIPVVFLSSSVGLEGTCFAWLDIDVKESRIDETKIFAWTRARNPLCLGLQRVGGEDHN